jgi:hypothetical protein
MVGGVVPPLSALVHRFTRPRFTPLAAGGEPAFGLPTAVAAGFAQRRAELDSTGRIDLDNSVDRADEAVRYYLRRAFAAGNSSITIEQLRVVCATKDVNWVRENLGPFQNMEHPEPGPAIHAGRRLKQCDQTTCGPAVVVVARMIADPAYAYQVSQAPTEFEQAQATVHAAANMLWPLAFGTTPWGLSATLNVHSGAFGARYGWSAIDPARTEDARAALGTAVRAAVDGWPVPLLIGRWEPRHWVLVVDGTPDAMRCYEPSGGRVVDITIDEVARRRADPLGFPDLHALVLPRTRIGAM